MLKSNPQRLAWATLLGALAVFCALCVGVIVFTQWLVFQSPTSLNVTLHVGQGTVGLLAPDTDERAVRSDPADVARDDRLSTDNLSQGYLAFADPYSGEVVATVMLRSNSVATLQSATRPRFSLSENPYAIRLKGVNGRLEVWVSTGLHREIRLEIDGPVGIARIGEKGDFLFESTPTYVKLTARDGSATLVSHDGRAQHLAMSTEGEIQQGDPDTGVRAGPVDLLPNSTFGQEQDWPKEWVCAHTPDPSYPNAPGGTYEFVKVDGRPTIHIERLAPNPGPAKTGCIQVLGDGTHGLDVTQYASLRLRVTMQVHYQSLSACGVAGSECPVMLKLTYLDQDGNARVWYHGFYTEAEPNVGRTICDSCWEPHQQINQDAWYTYESGNLFTDWPEGQRPGAIQQVEFYSSGHQYDVMLSEVSLVATLPDTSATAATTP
ncbi:MAG TPA: hypothetical protein VMT24_07365 [Aggregatilineaceae bacterium]|nr:hypothetical protein [Aggregatilineaceae bacterium]